MESQKDTKRNQCYSEGAIAEATNLNRNSSFVNDADDVDSEKSESGSESFDEDKVEQEIRKKEEELERQKEEFFKQKEKKKKKKKKTSPLHPKSFDSLTDQHSTPPDKVKTMIEGNDANQYPIQENVALQEKRGVVVVCYHSRFDMKGGYLLSPRRTAITDSQMMDDMWTEYGCDVLHFHNERTKFYEKDLIKLGKLEIAVQEKLDTIPQLAFFAFILSTHGEEREQRRFGGGTHFEHYFYSKDGYIHTQTLMNAIADIDGLQDKVKMFFIQAGRSRADTHLDDCMGTEEDNLHFEDSIVMFASMSGEPAFSFVNSPNEGGWLIKSLNDVLQSYTTGEKIFISDALTEVNRRVSQRKAAYRNNEQKKGLSCFLHNITEELYLKRE